MAKRPEMSQEAFEAKWKNVPSADQRFIIALGAVSDVLDTEELTFHLLPAGVERTLDKADRNRLLSILVECLGRLLSAPLLDRLKQDHRRRNGTHTGKRPEKPKSGGKRRKKRRK